MEFTEIRSFLQPDYGNVSFRSVGVMLERGEPIDRSQEVVHVVAQAVPLDRRYLAPGRVLLCTARISPPPQGRAGGHNGTLSEAVLTSGGQETRLPRQPTLDLEVKAGDVLFYVTPATGGYGDPFTRDPDLVLEDVLDEKITPSYAERVYAVAIDLANSEVDFEKTASLRAQRTGA